MPLTLTELPARRNALSRYTLAFTNLRMNAEFNADSFQIKWRHMLVVAATFILLWASRLIFIDEFYYDYFIHLGIVLSVCLLAKLLPRLLSLAVGLIMIVSSLMYSKLITNGLFAVDKNPSLAFLSGQELALVLSLSGQNYTLEILAVVISQIIICLSTIQNDSESISGSSSNKNSMIIESALVVFMCVASKYLHHFNQKQAFVQSKRTEQLGTLVNGSVSNALLICTYNVNTKQMSGSMINSAARQWQANHGCSSAVSRLHNTTTSFDDFTHTVKIDSLSHLSAKSLHDYLYTMHLKLVDSAQSFPKSYAEINNKSQSYLNKEPKLEVLRGTYQTQQRTLHLLITVRAHEVESTFLSISVEDVSAINEVASIRANSSEKDLVFLHGLNEIKEKLCTFLQWKGFKKGSADGWMVTRRQLTNNLDSIQTGSEPQMNNGENDEETKSNRNIDFDQDQFFDHHEVDYNKSYRRISTARLQNQPIYQHQYSQRQQSTSIDRMSALNSPVSTNRLRFNNSPNLLHLPSAMSTPRGTIAAVGQHHKTSMDQSEEGMNEMMSDRSVQSPQMEYLQSGNGVAVAVGGEQTLGSDDIFKVKYALTCLLNNVYSIMDYMTQQSQEKPVQSLKRMQVRCKSIQVRSIVGMLREIFDIQVNVVFTNEEDSSMRIITDPRRLKYVLISLVSAVLKNRRERLYQQSQQQQQQQQQPQGSNESITGSSSNSLVDVIIEREDGDSLRFSVVAGEQKGMLRDDFAQLNEMEGSSEEKTLLRLLQDSGIVLNSTSDKIVRQIEGRNVVQNILRLGAGQPRFLVQLPVVAFSFSVYQNLQGVVDAGGSVSPMAGGARHNSVAWNVNGGSIPAGNNTTGVMANSAIKQLVHVKKYSRFSNSQRDKIGSIALRDRLTSLATNGQMIEVDIDIVNAKLAAAASAISAAAPMSAAGDGGIGGIIMSGMVTLSGEENGKETERKRDENECLFESQSLAEFVSETSTQPMPKFRNQNSKQN